jgi:protease-4
MSFSRLVAPALILALLVPGSRALAQTVSVGTRTPTDGLLLPPASAATVEGAASGVINPAGIGLMRGLQFEYWYNHEVLGPDGPYGLDPHGIFGNGFYLAGTLFDVLGLGLSFEALNPAGSASYRKTHFTVAVSPTRAFSTAFAFNLFGSSDPSISSLTSWDWGMTIRPVKYLSLAASIRDFDAPQYYGLGTPGVGIALPRQYDFAMALRPLWQWLTLAADYQFLGEQNVPGQGLGPSQGRLGLTLDANIVPAGIDLTFGAGFALGTYPIGFNEAVSRTYLQLMLTFITEHVQASLAYVSYEAGQPFTLGSWNAGLRATMESWPRRHMIEAAIVYIDVDEELNPHSSPFAMFVSENRIDPFENLVAGLADASRDPTINGVALRVNDLDIGLARVEELRDAIVKLRTRGKVVAVLLGSGGDSEYYLASAADRIYAVPQSDYLMKGFSVEGFYLAEGLSKIGVRFDWVRAGIYKTAPEPLVRTGPSPEQIEVTRSILEDRMERYIRAVTDARGITREAFLRILGRGISTADQMRADRLVDATVYPDQFKDQVGIWLDRPAVFVQDYLHADRHQHEWGTLPQIAVVNISGTITGGESQQGPFVLVRTAGATTVTRALKSAGDSSGVGAVIVRIDSGGGDGSASELIWRGIDELRRKKPVIVSMGSAAASGGYYIAVAGDEVIADPSTITGSIGVFAIKPDLSGLLGKIGVHTSVDQLTPDADITSIFHGWTDPQKASMQAYVDAFYQTFLTRVANGRRMTVANVQGLAQGRVWTGAQAKDRGLIDGLGSLADAIDRAKARARIPPTQQVQLVNYGGNGTRMWQVGGAPGAADQAVQKLVSASHIGPILVLEPDRALTLSDLQIVGSH